MSKYKIIVGSIIGTHPALDLFADTQKTVISRMGSSIFQYTLVYNVFLMHISPGLLSMVFCKL